MKPKILVILPGLIPSTLINVATPVIDMHKAGRIIAHITLETTVREKDVTWSDLVILCRNTDPERALWFLSILEKNKPYIYDIDDNFFELSADTILGEYYRAPERIGLLKEFIQHASLVRVYSEPMKERALGLNPNTIKVTGPVDWRLLSPVREANEQKTVKIVYATSRVNDNLAEIFKPALKRILENYKDRVQVYFLGYNPDEFKTYPNVFFKPLNLNYEQYLRYFSSAGFDIGLAPLLDDIFHRSKSNLKVREYGACRIAGIYSNVDVYSSSVDHGENGLLVDNTPQAWYNAMSELIEHRELRLKIKEQAYLFAQNNFSQEAFAQLWHHQIIEVLQKPLKREDVFSFVDALIPRKSNPLLECVQEFFSRLAELPDTLRGAGLKSGLDSLAIPFQKLLPQTWLGRKYSYLSSGVKSYGNGFIGSYFRAVFQGYWLYLKIKLELLFPKK